MDSRIHKCFYLYYLASKMSKQMEQEVLEKDQALNDSKRSRRSQSKSNKDGPRYQCFCRKQYLSYPALYLHLKNKHEGSLATLKNTGHPETPRFIEHEEQGYKVYKMVQNQPPEQQNIYVPTPIRFESQPFNDQPIYFQTNGFMPCANINYQTFPLGYLPSPQDNTPIKYPLIEKAFSRFVQNLPPGSNKEKAEIELLIGVLIQSINDSCLMVTGVYSRRYTAEHDCKHLSAFLIFFETVWLPQAISQQNQEYYSFFVRNSSMIKDGKYKKIFKKLEQYLESQKMVNASKQVKLQSTEDNVMKEERGCKDQMEVQGCNKFGEQATHK